MAGKYQKKTETRDTKAIVRPPRNYHNSAPDNGESSQTQSKSESKPKYEVEKLETATSSPGEV